MARTTGSSRPPHRMVRWSAALVTALAVALSAAPALAQRVRPEVGKALGGRANPEYKYHKHFRIKRPMRRAPTRKLGNEAALTLPTSRGQVGFLDAEHYRNVRDVTLEMFRRHPPDKSYFVAVGRSPVAIASFMAELNPHMVMTFPASDMRLEIKPEWKAQYFEHFKELIPEQVLKGDKTIVLFDRSRAGSGTSLARLRGYLQEYLTSIGSKAKVEAVGLAPSGPLQTGVEHLNTSSFPRTFLYVQGQYDHDEAVAPFSGKHRIGAARMEDMQVNPNHQSFREALRERMSQDADLDRTLTTEYSRFIKDAD